jgi:hypothetical protein
VFIGDGALLLSSLFSLAGSSIINSAPYGDEARDCEISNKMAIREDGDVLDVPDALRFPSYNLDLTIYGHP